MLVFIDESGIHKTVDHSTFIVVYITMENYEAIEKVITALERELRIEPFHWSETVWSVKERFMQAVLPLEFSVKAAVVANPAYPARELERVVSHLLIEKNIAAVYIDGKKPKWYEHRMKKILRDKEISIKRLKTVRSSSMAGIRVADMVAGLLRWHFDNKHTERIAPYYLRLRKKIVVMLA